MEVDQNGVCCDEDFMSNAEFDSTYKTKARKVADEEVKMLTNVKFQKFLKEKEEEEIKAGVYKTSYGNACYYGK